MAKGIVSIKASGDYSKVKKYMRDLEKKAEHSNIAKYGEIGVRALRESTPIDTGTTANSWDYYVEHDNHSITIYWTNSNVVNGISIALILQYGHGTRNGGYVVGRDYINPAMRPVFDKMAEDAWREITAL